MVANFFQNLESARVEYLLISGQAAVLYGAATFSEDIDLWINPPPENCDRFLAALQASRALYYKLTNGSPDRCVALVITAAAMRMRNPTACEGMFRLGKPNLYRLCVILA
jgi:hypothetical protein